MKIQPPPDPSAPLKLLRAGKADVAISYEPELLLARDAGAETLVAVGALVQTPLTSLMALPASSVKSAKDLAGKRVGTSGIPYQSAYLKTILEKAGVDPASVKETNVGFNLVPAMVSKKVDADARRVLELRGRPARSAAQAGDPAHGEPRRADLRRADPRRPARVARRGGRVAAAALHHRHRRRAPAGARRPGRRASTRC